MLFRNKNPLAHATEIPEFGIKNQFYAQMNAAQKSNELSRSFEVEIGRLKNVIII